MAELNKQVFFDRYGFIHGKESFVFNEDIRQLDMDTIISDVQKIGYPDVISKGPLSMNLATRDVKLNQADIYCTVGEKICLAFWIALGLKIKGYSAFKHNLFLRYGEAIHEVM